MLHVLVMVTRHSGTVIDMVRAGPAYNDHRRIPIYEDPAILRSNVAGIGFTVPLPPSVRGKVYTLPIHHSQHQARTFSIIKHKQKQHLDQESSPL